MNEIADLFQHITLVGCIAAFALIALAYAAFAACDMVARLRRLFGSSKVHAIVATAAVVCAVMYGGSKSIRWDAGLRDNGTEITNDTVTVRWTYSGIPSASSVFIDVRECGSDGEWANLGETVASALEWSGTLANATNYDYWIYSTYVPPVPVHTNGVWVGQAYETKARVGAKAFLILNGKVQEGGRTIAPPSAKRKDEQE